MHSGPMKSLLIEDDEFDLITITRMSNLQRPNMSQWPKMRYNALKCYTLNLSSSILDEATTSMLNKGLGFGLNRVKHSPKDMQMFSKSGNRRLLINEKFTPDSDASQQQRKRKRQGNKKKIERLTN